ncbi:hypothetical protein [Tsukamurella sp. NPDC003166]|uniref:hypothetical protein n=1 Tax=Tsukamurella sp. NPDC003166 TaxID=3154444 RepID=UPI0033B197FB
MHIQTIRKHLHEAGITPRHEYVSKVTPQMAEQAAVLYDEGLSTVTVGKRPVVYTCVLRRLRCPAPPPPLALASHVLRNPVGQARTVASGNEVLGVLVIPPGRIGDHPTNVLARAYTTGSRPADHLA